MRDYAHPRRFHRLGGDRIGEVEYHVGLVVHQILDVRFAVGVFDPGNLVDALVDDVRPGPAVASRICDATDAFRI